MGNLSGKSDKNIKTDMELQIEFVQNEQWKYTCRI